MKWNRFRSSTGRGKVELSLRGQIGVVDCEVHYGQTRNVGDFPKGGRFYNREMLV